MNELYRVVWGYAPPENFLKIGPSETPYPAFTGSIAINSCVYFVELFSVSLLTACDPSLSLYLCNLLSGGGRYFFPFRTKEAKKKKIITPVLRLRYSWFPCRSTKIHHFQVFKIKIHDSYMFCYYDSWFMIRLPPPILLIFDLRTPTYPWRRVIIFKESIQMDMIKKSESKFKAPARSLFFFLFFFYRNPDEKHLVFFLLGLICQGCYCTTFSCRVEQQAGVHSQSRPYRTKRKLLSEIHASVSSNGNSSNRSVG